MRVATKIASLATLALVALEEEDLDTVKKNLKEIAHDAVDMDARTGKPDPSTRKKRA